MNALDNLFEAIETCNFGPSRIYSEFIRRYGLDGPKFYSGFNDLDSMLACLEQARESVSKAHNLNQNHVQRT
jgi:hypothetical protein